MKTGMLPQLNEASFRPKKFNKISSTGGLEPKKGLVLDIFVKKKNSQLWNRYEVV